MILYNKTETSRIRSEFWIAFGQYMKPILNVEGRRINWPNYKTGVRNIYFRMKAERDFASIGIEVCHVDEELQELYFDQFAQFKKMLETVVGEEWDWKLHQENEYGQVVSRIERILPDVNVMDSDDWSKIISFLKPRIILLDEFWETVKPGFES